MIQDAMLEKRISAEHVAEVLDISVLAAVSKIYGRKEFTADEAKKLHGALFREYRFEEIFPQFSR